MKLIKRSIITLQVVIMIILSISLTFAESNTIGYEAEPIQAEKTEDFYGTWQCKYIAQSGITILYKDFLKLALAKEMEITEEQAESHFADYMIYLIIEEDKVSTYMGNADPEESNDIKLSDGKLIIQTDAGTQITISMLSDGNLMLTNPGGNYIFEKQSIESNIPDIDTINSESKTDRSQEEVYKLLIINDDANLLTDEETIKVIDSMKPITAYANVGFISYPADGNDDTPSATKARNWGTHIFGNNEGFVVFIIDMKERHLDIYASKEIAGILTAKEMNSIVDNTYRYASRGEYTECICMTFKLIENILVDE